MSVGSRAGGAAKGAATGAALGSVIPGIGTAIGGIVGGLAGLFSSPGDDDQSAKLAPQIGAFNVDQIQGSEAGAQSGLDQNQSFLNALNAQNGLGNQNQVYNQLQGVASGTGPNPAQALLNQATGQNVANQAALMASQRGVSANPGMIARQAAQQGANIQQQAAGQAATLQANQSLGALGQLNGLTQTQVGNQLAQTNNVGQLGLSQQQQVINALDAQNKNNIANTAQANGSNTQLNLQNNAQNYATTGTMLGAAGKSLGLAGSAGSAAGAAGGAASSAGGVLGGLGSVGSTMAAAAEGGVIGSTSMLGKHLNGLKMAKGGKVPALVSPGEIVLSPDKAKAVAEGKASPLSGERVPGKAKVKGNSYANDTVRTTLEEGGVVIPRSKSLGDDVHKKAQEFVAAVMAHHGIKGKKK